MSQLAGFVVIYEAFLRIEPNKDLFRQLFEVKSHMEHDSDGGVLTPMGGMNIQMRYGVSRSFSCLPLRRVQTRAALGTRTTSVMPPSSVSRQ